MGEVDTAVIDRVFTTSGRRERLRDLQTQRGPGLDARNALEAPMEDALVMPGGKERQRVSWLAGLTQAVSGVVAIIVWFCGDIRLASIGVFR